MFTPYIDVYLTLIENSDTRTDLELTNHQKPGDTVSPGDPMLC